jgi:hypothetical protein
MGIKQDLASDLLEGGDWYQSEFLTKLRARQFSTTTAPVTAETSQNHGRILVVPHRLITFKGAATKRKNKL